MKYKRYKYINILYIKRKTIEKSNVKVNDRIITIRLLLHIKLRYTQSARMRMSVRM